MDCIRVLKSVILEGEVLVEWFDCIEGIKDEEEDSVSNIKSADSSLATALNRNLLHDDDIVKNVSVALSVSSRGV